MSSKESTCANCSGKCCKYVMVKIAPPRLRCDRDEHRWLLMHEGIELWVESRQWYMLVHTRCTNLTRDNKCGIYAHRPDVCREHDEEACEFDGVDPDTRIFRTADEYDEYLESRGLRWTPAGERTAR